LQCNITATVIETNCSLAGTGVIQPLNCNLEGEGEYVNTTTTTTSTSTSTTTTTTSSTTTTTTSTSSTTTTTTTAAPTTTTTTTTAEPTTTTTTTATPTTTTTTTASPYSGGCGKYTLFDEGDPAGSTFEYYAFPSGTLTTVSVPFGGTGVVVQAYTIPGVTLISGDGTVTGPIECT